MKKYKVILFCSLLFLSLALIVLGIIAGDFEVAAETATYGNFDVPNTTSWIKKIAPGIKDYASSKVYGEFHPTALIIVGCLFLVTLLISVVKNKKDYIFRKLTQWTTFIVARLGVFRVAGVCPIKRTGFGIFPFLNCQACEMATGACPIGMIQKSLMNKSFPAYALGIIMLFGVLLGRAVCGFLCPFGFFADILDRVLNIKIIRKKVKSHPKLGYIKYLSIIFICSGFVWVMPYFCIFVCQGANIYGLIPYYVTTGLKGFIDAFTKGPLTPIFIFHMISIAVLIIIGIIVSGRWFCRYICPLGAIYGIFNYTSLIKISHNDNKCSNCDRCKRICPMDINLKNKDFLTRTNCILCGRCVKICEARNYQIGNVILQPKSNKEVQMVQKQKQPKLIHIYMNILNMKPIDAALYARKYTKFYRNFYYDRNFKNFNEVPIFSKYDYSIFSPYDFINADLYHKIIHYGETSGSSGNPTPVFLTKRDFRNMVVMIASSCPYYKMIKVTAKNNNVAVNLLTYGYTIAGFSIGMLLQHAKLIVAQLGSRSTIALPKRNAMTVTKLNPSIIASTPLDFMAIMNIIREDHPEKYENVVNNLKILLSTAEPCAVSRQKQIEKFFGIVHINLYASVDGFIAMPCPCGEKHIIEGAHYVELIDKDKNNVGQYGQGRLVFTTLIKRATPMVRFLIDDYVTISKSACPYGYKKSIAPHGRFELTVAFDNETYGNLDFEEIIYSFGLVMDYRVVIYEDFIEVVLEKYPCTPEYNIESLIQNFEERFRLKCRVELVEYGQLSDYRDVRTEKSIIKVLDKRKYSTQNIPNIL